MADVLSDIHRVSEILSEPPCHENSTFMRAVWAAVGESEARKVAVLRALRGAIPAAELADLPGNFPVVAYATQCRDVNGWFERAQHG